MDKNLVSKVGITANMEIDKDDLIVIAVAKREQELLAKGKLLEGEIKLLKADREKLSVTLQKTYENRITKTLNPPINGIIGGLATLQGVQPHSIERELRFTPASNGGTPRINCSIKIGNEYNRSFSIVRTFEYSNEENELRDSVKIFDDRISSKQCELIDVKKELKNLASTERQARAALALKILQGTEQGKELIRAINDDNVKLLDTDLI